MARNRLPAASAEAVIARSGGCCERCGSTAQQIHHRTPRGMGGTKDPAIHHPTNLLHLCAACHGWVEVNRSAAMAHGWLVSRYQDPATAPVYRWGQWWTVTATELLANRPLDPPF